MSEAEKKWNQKANKDCQSYVHGICDTYRMGREAYKAALRREIEEMKEERASPQWTTAIDKILELLDTVEPISESKEPKP